MFIGGVSVACHLVSPLSKGLFRNAIPQSGAMLALSGPRTPTESAEDIKPYLQRIGNYNNYYLIIN